MLQNINENVYTNEELRFLRQDVIALIIFYTKTDCSWMKSYRSSEKCNVILSFP